MNWGGKAPEVSEFSQGFSGGGQALAARLGVWAGGAKDLKISFKKKPFESVLCLLMGWACRGFGGSCPSQGISSDLSDTQLKDRFAASPVQHRVGSSGRGRADSGFPARAARPGRFF